jgi:hypothetical protein
MACAPRLATPPDDNLPADFKPMRLMFQGWRSI